MVSLFPANSLFLKQSINHVRLQVCTSLSCPLVTDDGDDSVIPLDDEEEYSRVKSLDDEFGDDAILVE